MRYSSLLTEELIGIPIELSFIARTTAKGRHVADHMVTYIWIQSFTYSPDRMTRLWALSIWGGSLLLTPQFIDDTHTWHMEKIHWSAVYRFAIFFASGPVCYSNNRLSIVKIKLTHIQFASFSGHLLATLPLYTGEYWHFFNAITAAYVEPEANRISDPCIYENIGW